MELLVFFSPTADHDPEVCYFASGRFSGKLLVLAVINYSDTEVWCSAAVRVSIELWVFFRSFSSQRQ